MLRWTVVLLAFLVSASVAGAQTGSWSMVAPLPLLQSLSEPDSGIAALALAGEDRIAWATWVGYRRLELYLAGPGMPVSDLGGFPVKPGESMNLDVSIEASPNVVAAGVTGTSCGGHPTECTPYAWSGATVSTGGQPLQVAAACNLQRVLAVSGTAVATDTAVCDLATGQTQALPTGTLGVRLAGDYAAVALADGSLEVERWRTGEEMYRIAGAQSGYPLPPAGPGGTSSEFDLDADGTTVFTQRAGATPESGYVVAWASPTAPQPHTFYSLAPDVFPANAVLRLSDGLGAVGVGSTVTLVDLSGSVHAVVDLPGSIPSWNLSGSHLAWFERPCEEGLFAAADAQAPAAFVAPATGPCAAPRLTGVSVAPGSRLRLALSCPVAATLGCLASSSVTLHAPVQRGISRRLGYWFLDGPVLAADPGQSRTVDVRLPRGAIRLLKCGAAVTITARGAENADELPSAATPSTVFKASLGGRGCGSAAELSLGVKP